MAKKKNPLVFMDVSIDGDPVERMVFEVLFVLVLMFTIYAATFAMFNLMNISSHSFSMMLLPRLQKTFVHYVQVL